jgi:hypothetical protein
MQRQPESSDPVSGKWQVSEVGRAIAIGTNALALPADVAPSLGNPSAKAISRSGSGNLWIG